MAFEANDKRTKRVSVDKVEIFLKLAGNYTLIKYFCEWKCWNSLHPYTICCVLEYKNEKLKALKHIVVVVVVQHMVNDAAAVYTERSERM